MNRPSAVVALLGALLCTACTDLSSPADPPVPPSGSAGASDASEAGIQIADSRGRAAVALPFKGEFAGTQVVTPLTPPLASVEVTTSGTGSFLGRFTMELPHTVNFATSTASGTATIVAANGDVLVATFTGQAQVGPVVSIVEHATIQGGTGRFAGSAGTFTIERVFDPAAGTTSGSFAGTISSPGAGG
jgi:hypothetical protein